MKSPYCSICAVKTAISHSENYIARNVIDKVAGWKGGTTYSYVLERNLQHSDGYRVNRAAAS